MVSDGISQQRIIKYFEGEGYTENDIIREITEFEMQQYASAHMQSLGKKGKSLAGDSAGVKPSEPIKPADPTSPSVEQKEFEAIKVDDAKRRMSYKHFEFRFFITLGVMIAVTLLIAGLIYLTV